MNNEVKNDGIEIEATSLSVEDAEANIEYSPSTKNDRRRRRREVRRTRFVIIRRLRRRFPRQTRRLPIILREGAPVPRWYHMAGGIGVAIRC